MREAEHYRSEKGVVTCVLCPRNCRIKDGNTGFCRVRKNISGKLYSLVYGRVAGGVAIDPVEKKPLFHFLPGKSILSFGTVGCNLKCRNCQNWTTSQKEPGQLFEKDLLPKDIVRFAKEQGCGMIAYTYNEPTIFFEFMRDTARLAKKEGLKNVIVSNGFINQEPLEELCRYIDAANIDLKGFNDVFYKKTTAGWLEPILRTIKTLKKKGVWVELTNLLIPGLNDTKEDIRKMCEWIRKDAGDDTPLHFSAFHPDFEMQNIPPTPVSLLLNAYDIARSEGLKFVYIGNVITRDYENTKCPKCGALIVERLMFRVTQINIKNGGCAFCKENVSGVF